MEAEEAGRGGASGEALPVRRFRRGARARGLLHRERRRPPAGPEPVAARLRPQNHVQESLFLARPRSPTSTESCQVGIQRGLPEPQDGLF